MGIHHSVRKRPQAVVIGAGVGGLCAAATLAHAGLDVTVLEAHLYPGGCASTFPRQGYRFDAGATLAAGFYPGGPMEMVAQATGVAAWPGQATDTAMMVHLPNLPPMVRVAGEDRWHTLRAAFGAPALDFFHWQEHTADALWQLALRLPPWPTASTRRSGQSPAQLERQRLARTCEECCLPDRLGAGPYPLAFSLGAGNMIGSIAGIVKRR